MLLRRFQDFGMEDMRCQFLAGHLDWVLFHLLWHGGAMISRDMDLLKLIEQFSCEDNCREALMHLRWPKGVVCLRCGHDKVSPVNDRKVFDCNSCHYQFSVTVGTTFHDSHLSLTKWFLITYLMTESKKGLSAAQVYRMLGKKSYKTAWYLCQRIRAAMKDAQPELLGGTAEIDETYVGGKTHGKGAYGRSLKAKEVVIGIKQRGGQLRFFHAEDCKSGTLAKYIKENVREDVEVVMTDDFAAYPKAMIAAGIHGKKHKTINHTAGVYVDGDITTNGIESAFSLLKRGIIGSWHKISAKHLQAYLDEMTFRFDNRNNPYLFRDTMLKLIEAPVLEYKRLIAA
jgi:transposase-like protein